jgi:hypothetical protein
LRTSLSQWPCALRPEQVLPDELALRKSGYRSLQAVCAERGGVREEVLQQGHDALLWQGRLLPEEPLVLRDREDTEVLPAGAEVRDPDPAGRHRRQARNCRDLLSARAVSRQPQALLPARSGCAVRRRTKRRSRPQPVLLPDGTDLRLGRQSNVLPEERHSRVADLLQRQMRRHPLRRAELRYLQQRLRLGHLS